MRPVHLVPAGAVLLALGAIAGAAQLVSATAPAAAHAATAAQQVAVTSAARACPPVPGGASGRVALIAAEPTAKASPGLAELAPLPLAGVELRTLNPISQTQPGLLSLLSIPAAQSVTKKTTVLQGWSVTASGTMAQAMEAEEATSTAWAASAAGNPDRTSGLSDPASRAASARSSST